MYDTSTYRCVILIFVIALEWQKTYDIHAILSANGITPGGRYQPHLILDTVGKYLGKTGSGTINPAMTCRKEHGYPDHLIYEMVICFDKELKLMNCDNVAAGTYDGCPHHDDSFIMYPQAQNLGKRYGRELTPGVLYSVKCKFYPFRIVRVLRKFTLNY